MKKVLAILTIIFAVSCVFAADKEVLEFQSKIGFTNGEDKIVEHRFLDDGKKIVIIGLKTLQIWDVESGKLINSVSHTLPQFAPRGFFDTYVLLGLPKAFDWRPFIVDENGKWIITAEVTDANKRRSAIVRDLKDLTQIAVMELPDVSIESMSFDKANDEIMTIGVSEKDEKINVFTNWDKDKFTPKTSISIKEYKWHQKIRADRKMLVGSGDTKILWSAITKEGEFLTLRDAKTGAIEKEYTAKNLKPETSFQDTIVSDDEKLLISRRNDRIFVWEIDGDGQPKFEISNPNPKGNFSFKKLIDKKYIAVKIDEEIRVYDIAGNGTPKFSVAAQNPKEDLSFRKLLNDRFVVIKVDNKVRVYDTLGGTKLKFEIVSENPKDTMAFRDATEDGKYFVAGDDQKVLVFETAGSGKPLYEIVRDSEKERFPAIQFLDDKNLLAIARINRSEKKPPRTEFYDIPTGKPAFTTNFEVGYDVQFTPDGRFMYQTVLGAFEVWDMKDQKYYTIQLRTYTPSNYNYSTQQSEDGTPENSESIDFSPDYRYILRHGDTITAVFETETGEQVQTIFDPERVKYDKQNKIKNSGIGNAGWLNNGKYIYAIESPGILRSSKTVSFWKLKN